MYDVIVIGAGPAGLFSAIQAAKKYNQLLVLEKKASPGKKLLITGSGQCNLTHTGNVKTFLSNYGEKGAFLGPSLRQFSPQDLLDFFKQQGLSFYTTEEGKYFPKSNSAQDILDVLINQCEKSGVKIQSLNPVTKIQAEDSGFRIFTSKNQYTAKKIITSTGGKSYPGTGSEGDGYLWAKEMGHRIIPPKPALTSVIIEDYSFVNLAGLSFKDLGIKIFRENKTILNSKGDLLFTHKGLSGPVILNHSRNLQAKDIVEINFFNSENPQSLKNLILDYCGNNGKNAFISFFKGFPIGRNFIKMIFNRIEIPLDLKASDLNKKHRQELIKQLTQHKMEIKKLEGFSHAMVTAGGVDLKQIDKHTMESKIQRGLFFAGEIIDIDGNTGGYNLQAAFSTAFLAGTSV